MKKINISIRIDDLDERIVEILEKESKNKNRSKFIKECIKKSVHDEHIINKINSLENEILEIKSILLKGNFNNNILKFKNEETNENKNEIKSVHDEHNLKSLEQDLLNAMKF